MEIIEAFEVLGLPISATREEIESKYKELIKIYHPDRESGDGEKAARINSAKDIALAYLTSSSAIMRQMVDIMRIDNNAVIKRQEYRIRSEGIINQIRRKQLSKYSRLKDYSKTIGAISAAVALITSKLVPALGKIFGESTVVNLISIYFMVSAGIMYIMVNRMVEKAKDDIDEAKEALNDKSYYYELLNSITGAPIKEMKGIIKDSEFQGIIKDWLRKSRHQFRMETEKGYVLLHDSMSITHTFRKIGAEEFAKLFISKGLELGVLEEVEINNEYHISIGYRIKVVNKF